MRSGVLEDPIDLICGPFDGYYVVVSVGSMGDLGGGRFIASYKIFRHAPGEVLTENCRLKHRVAGLWNSVEEAQGVAVQLARLKIASFPMRGGQSNRRSAPELADFAPAPASFEPTVPCPLMPVAEREYVLRTAVR